MDAPRPPEIGEVFLDNTEMPLPNEIMADIKKHGKEIALEKWEMALKNYILDLDKKWNNDSGTLYSNVESINDIKFGEGKFYFTSYVDLGRLIFQQWNAGYAFRSIKEMIKDWLEKDYINIKQANLAQHYIDRLQEWTEARDRSKGNRKLMSKYELEELGLYVPNILIGNRDELEIYDSESNKPVVKLRRLPFQYPSWDELIDEVNNKLDDEYMLSSSDKDTFTLIRIKHL